MVWIPIDSVVLRTAAFLLRQWFYCMGICALITLGFLVPSTGCEKQTKEAFSRVTTVCSEFLFLSLVPFMEVLYSVSGWLLLLFCRISFPSYFVHGHCVLWLQRNGTACRVIGVLTQATFFSLERLHSALTLLSVFSGQRLHTTYMVSTTNVPLLTSLM